MKATAALGVLILLLLAPPAVSQIPDDKLIVPGVRIGKWTLKMTINDLLRMNGQRVGGGGGAAIQRASAKDFVSSDFWSHNWYHLGFSAITMGRDSQRVEVLVTVGGEYKTAKGIAVKSASRGDVDQAYGKPTVVTQPLPNWSSPIHDKAGLGMDFDPNGVARSIFIFRVGSARQIFKF